MLSLERGDCLSSLNGQHAVVEPKIFGCVLAGRGLIS